jgi:hypothetical protein
VFRRRTDTTTEEPPTPDETAPSQGKGRPTPKRRDAVKGRQPIVAPRTRKEAYRRERERGATERARMARGEDGHLLKRDQGPVRKLARDFVDSRRTFGEFFMYLTILVLVLSTIGPLTMRIYLQTFGLPVMLVVFIGEAVFLSNRVKKLARERFPDESVQGLALYTVTRSMQIRRLRMPKPRLKPGQKAEV